MLELWLLGGLTGVGKRSLVRALFGQHRELTDRVINPAVLADERRPLAPPTAWRAVGPPSATTPSTRAARPSRCSGRSGACWGARGCLFDNLRGLSELRFAAEKLPEARFFRLDSGALGVEQAVPAVARGHLGRRNEETRP